MALCETHYETSEFRIAASDMMQTLMQSVKKHGAIKLVVAIVSFHLSGATLSSAVAQEEAESVISGSVVDAKGKPAVGAMVALCRHSEDMSHGKKVSADADGKFSIKIVANAKLLESMHLECKNNDGSEMSYLALRTSVSKLDLQSLELRLDKVKKARMAIVDGEGKPVAGASAIARLGDAFGRVVSATTDEFGIAELTYTDSAPIELAFAWKDSVGFDYRFFQVTQQGLGAVFSVQKPEQFKLEGASPMKLKFIDNEKRPLKGIKVYPLNLRKPGRANLRATDLNLSYFLRFVQEQTDADGEVTFAWLPAWHKGRLSFNSSGGDEFVHSTISVDPSTARGLKEVQLDRTVPIRGNVVGVDGKPSEGIVISATGVGSAGTSKTTMVQTDEAGNYEVRVAPHQIYMVIVKDKQWASTPQQGFVVHSNTPVEGKDFKLRKATRIFGKVRSGFWLADVANHKVVISQLGESNSELGGGRSRPADTFEVRTDHKGNFELFVGDGEFVSKADGRVTEFRINGEESYDLGDLKTP